MKQGSGNPDADSGDGLWVMPFGARPANRGAGSGQESSRRVAPVGRGRRGGKTAPLDHEEAVSGNAEGSVVMESSPAAALIMSQSQFLFQFFIVALDDPAVFG